MRTVYLAKKKNNTKVVSTSPMDMGLLEQMTRLMKENDLNTVDVRDGDKRVILKRGAVTVSTVVPQFAPAAAIHPGLPSGTPTPPPTSASAEDANLLSIKSPMV